MTFIEHLDDATLQDLQDGLLEEAEATAARTHLTHCAPCARRAAEAEALFAALDAPPAGYVEPPADFFAAVMARVDAEVMPRFAPERRLRTALLALAGSAATAGAGAGLVWAGGGVPIEGLGAGFATTLADLAARADLALTVARAGAPMLAAASVASLAVLTPLILKAMQSLQPKTARVPVR